MKDVDNTKAELGYVTHLECLSCGEIYTLERLKKEQGTILVNVCYDICFGPLDVKYDYKKLKEIYVMAKSLDHKGTLEQIEQLKGEIFQLTLRRYKHLIVRRFVNNLYYRDIESLFIFVMDSDVDSTNNISERELRELVIQRDMTHGSGSQRGATAMVMLISIIQTLKLSKKNVLQGLQQIIEGRSGC